MSIQRKIVTHAVCEINELKKGNVSCANKMLIERIELMNRLEAYTCLTEWGADSSITSYIWEQIKEMASKLVVTI